MIIVSCSCAPVAIASSDCQKMSIINLFRLLPTCLADFIVTYWHITTSCSCASAANLPGMTFNIAVVALINPFKLLSTFIDTWDTYMMTASYSCAPSCDGFLQNDLWPCRSGHWLLNSGRTISSTFWADFFNTWHTWTLHVIVHLQQIFSRNDLSPCRSDI